jgi:hypothetical protein
MGVDGLFEVCVWFGQLFQRWSRLDLWSVGMSVRLKVPSWVSFWVAFRGCSFELTNRGHQYWDSIAGVGGLMNSNEGEMKVMNSRT